MCKSTGNRDIMEKQLAEQHITIVSQTEQIKQLLARVASYEQKLTTTAGSAPVLDLTPWKQRIDEVYGGLNAAVEHYYTMMSKDRVLQFRTQFKKKAKDAMTENLVIDANDLKLVSKEGHLISNFI